MTEPRRALSHVRRQLDDYVRVPTSLAVTKLLLVLVAYGLFVTGALVARPTLLRAVCSVVVGLLMGRLFLIGHDAGHGSYTGSRRLNAVVGRVAFTPCLHPFSQWVYVHNKIHHVYTNLRNVDFVWMPLSTVEYEALGWFGKLRQRAYRRTVAFGLYYTCEIWLPRLVGGRDRGRWQSAATRGAELSAIAAVILGHVAAAWSVGAGLVALFWTLFVPFLLMSWTIGFVIYFNHTHPTVAWYGRRAEWSYGTAQIEGTVQLAYSRRWRWVFGNVMDHVAHHVHTGIPLANLQRAQARLQELIGDQLTVEQWTPRAHAEIVARCKLYDYDAHRWTDFRGRYTSACTRGWPSGAQEPVECVGGQDHRCQGGGQIQAGRSA